MEAFSDKVWALIRYYALISIMIFFFKWIPEFLENLNPNVQADAEDSNCDLNSVSSWVFFYYSVPAVFEFLLKGWTTTPSIINLMNFCIGKWKNCCFLL